MTGHPCPHSALSRRSVQHRDPLRVTGVPRRHGASNNQLHGSVTTTTVTRCHKSPGSRRASNTSTGHRGAVGTVTPVPVTGAVSSRPVTRCHGSCSGRHRAGTTKPVTSPAQAVKDQQHQYPLQGQSQLGQSPGVTCLVQAVRGPVAPVSVTRAVTGCLTASQP